MNVRYTEGKYRPSVVFDPNFKIQTLGEVKTGDWSEVYGELVKRYAGNDDATCYLKSLRIKYPFTEKARSPKRSSVEVKADDES